MLAALSVLLLSVIPGLHPQRQHVFINNGDMAPLWLGKNPLPHQYIVMFKPTASDQEIDKHLFKISSSTVIVRHRYNLPGARGYAFMTKSPEEALYLIRTSKLVQYVEADQQVFVMERQYFPPWGLARISHRTRDFPNMLEYLYYPQAGEGVTVYVADTGVRISHSEFEKRASWGKTIPQGEPDQDNNGHGTHVAGTIAGQTYGVAKKARIVAVKVLSGEGSGANSDVIAGLAFIWQHYKENRPEKGAVVNLSLSSWASTAMNTAVEALIDAGIFVVAAAGNSNMDACQFSPGNSPKVITVAASDRNDVRASFSNWGPCVTLFAPGKEVKSAHNQSDEDTTILSGTSMATPHVVGVIALLLGRERGGIDPDSMKWWLLNIATNNTVKDVKNTTNALLWSDPPPTS